MKIRHLFRPVNVADERAFQRENVRRRRERYLRTNPLDRYAVDAAYRAKVDTVRDGLSFAGEPVRGYILDIGGNTAGEATILQQEGFRFVVGDINELALEISRERVAKFALKQPGYVALDAHALPFIDSVFSAVTVIEALHHFPNYSQALREIQRVLKPGGIFLSYEPNALNPIRRLSEVRDRLRGTVETSFHATQVEALCRGAGFSVLDVKAIRGATSCWKLQEVPVYRRNIARLHGYLQGRCPTLFGPLLIQARKAGNFNNAADDAFAWRQWLCSPADGLPVAFDHATGTWVGERGDHRFPDNNGIPVLVSGDHQVVV